jgi:hypothetical protein
MPARTTTPARASKRTTSPAPAPKRTTKAKPTIASCKARARAMGLDLIEIDPCPRSREHVTVAAADTTWRMRLHNLHALLFALDVDTPDDEVRDALTQAARAEKLHALRVAMN